MSSYDGFDEQWLASYQRKHKKPDMLQAEAHRQARQAARGGLDTGRREGWIQSEAIKQIRLRLLAHGYSDRLVCGFDGGSESERERQRQLDRGYVVGWPDVVVAVAVGGYAALYLEIKTTDGRVSSDQAQVHDDLRVGGNAVAVCFDVLQAVQAVEDYLTPSEIE